MIAVTLEFDTVELEKARGEIFAALHRCPCCGEDRKYSFDTPDLQLTEFLCGAEFYRLPNSAPSVSRPCAGPSYVAVRGLEVDAAKAAAKAVRV